MEQPRKRQLPSDISENSGNSEAPAIKKEPIVGNSESFEEQINNIGAFPILTSMITAPMKKNEEKIVKQPQPPNYFMIFNAFRQFLNGYLAAGGDPNLANTLANYAAALPIPPNSIPKIPKNSENSTEKIDKEAELGETSDEGNDGMVKVENASDKKPIVPRLPTRPVGSILNPQQSKNSVDDEVATEIQRLREAAFGRYKNVLCVICNEWICSRNRKNHIEAHLNYRPYKCSACDYARRREIFVVQHIKTQHSRETGVEMLSSVDLNVALEVDRLADECVERTRKLIESMQEKKDGGFGEGQEFDAKALEMMMAEEAEKKVVVIESVTEVRAKVANYHRRQRTKVLKKIYDTDVAKQTELKIVKEEEEEDGIDIETGRIGVQVSEGCGINLADLVKMMEEQQNKGEKQKNEQKIDSGEELKANEEIGDTMESDETELVIAE